MFAKDLLSVKKKKYVYMYARFNVEIQYRMETREITRQSSIDDHKKMIAVNNKRHGSKKINYHAKSR